MKRARRWERAEGLLEGTLKGIEACRELKFGVAGLELMPELREIHDQVLLDKILHTIRKCGQPGGSAPGRGLADPPVEARETG